MFFVQSQSQSLLFDRYGLRWNHTNKLFNYKKNSIFNTTIILKQTQIRIKFKDERKLLRVLQKVKQWKWFGKYNFTVVTASKCITMESDISSIWPFHLKRNVRHVDVIYPNTARFRTTMNAIFCGMRDVLVLYAKNALQSKFFHTMFLL